ncbi:hypothetical protein GCM10011490_18140 [Pseudoclavibacter endophyticus]|uniref:Uncharacterized protein n=1 Tax=Pseudoclavibacter endophyticus TaxID=1778590 RepID=A0A6H9WR85_9MICO|nr:hypothetical protein [Pseudoclavibacter endophyticus]KAB1648840.1 hypothetical protein F8O04_00605 [Pseudoclavibacter endophyticus]GGA67980.1 hypothetical protein GCM10011490_18140 [Pseudoclavibacter endophyticus]
MTTATTLEAIPARRGAGNRTLNVIRLQLISTQSFVWVPLVIVAGTLAICLIVFAMIPGDGVKPTGAAQAPLWYFAALGVQAMTLTFPFSQAMSVTRREFFVGTLVVGAIGGAMIATLFIALAGLEVITNGYGMNGRIAYLEWLFEPSWASAWLTYFTATLLLYVIGFWAATVYKRFGWLVLTAVGVVLALALVVGLFIITRTESWPAVFGWFAAVGPLAITLIGLGVTAVLAAGAYLTLRKAVV